VWRWPQADEELVEEQERLASATPEPWSPGSAPLVIAGCYVCFSRGRPGRGEPGEPGWAAAALVPPAGEAVTVARDGAAGAAYEPGLLARREGPLLEQVVQSLPSRPDVLLVNATGRDHPRRAGLALHLGAVVDVPTVGVTDRPLVAEGPGPGRDRGDISALTVEGEVVAYWVRTRRGTRPLVAHAAWRTSPEVAVEVLLGSVGRWRTPTSLRAAREEARLARAVA